MKVYFGACVSWAVLLSAGRRGLSFWGFTYFSYSFLGMIIFCSH